MTDLSWLPNFFIAGAPKSGTSSLHSYLAAHPDALGSREKETYFFCDPQSHMFRPNANAALGFDTWQDQFAIPNGPAPKVIFESTPSYLYSRSALMHIPSLPSQPKCLFILREPAAQIYSLFTYFRDNWTWVPQDMTFSAFLNAVQNQSDAFGGNELAQNAIAYAQYIDYLLPWRATLGDDRIMVANLDDLAADVRGFTQRVAVWLGLDPDFYDTYSFARENETYSPRSRLLHRVNVGLRGVLPKGQAYNLLRSLYRRANTTRPVGATTEDKIDIQALRTHFAVSNNKLKQEFGITFKDLSGEIFE